jgi:hypothetical protein
VPRFSQVSHRQSRFPRPTDSHGKGREGQTLEEDEEESGNVRTVAVTVMRRHFLAYSDRPDHAEGDVAPLAEKFAIVITIMLSFRGTGNVRVSNE